MRSSINLNILFVWLAVGTVGVVIAHFVFSIGWGVSIVVAALMLLAVFLNGLLASWEDEQPSGFHNPRPDQTQKDSPDE